jgi:exopolyphosphatase/guanosine-5'-triphosphate,3'-diphosphate pyrophosphatase
MTSRMAAGSIQSAIDLGTNTILMVTGRVRPDGSVEILDDAHEIARLGKGVDAGGRILPDTIDRVCRFLCGYRKRAKELGSERVRAFGTSALRDAANKDEFIAAAAREDVELVELSGDQEARYTYAGAFFGLELPAARYAVLDIGGGSTELALGTDGRVETSQSVDVGAVRVTERFFSHLPPDARQVLEAEAMIGPILDGLFALPADVALVGVAGTVSTQSFDSRDLDGHRLLRPAVTALSERLLTMEHADIVALPQVSDQRADIIGAGALILRTFLGSRGLEQITVSTRGIRYGLLLDMLSGSL